MAGGLNKSPSRPKIRKRRQPAPRGVNLSPPLSAVPTPPDRPLLSTHHHGAGGGSGGGGATGRSPHATGCLLTTFRDQACQAELGGSGGGGGAAAAADTDSPPHTPTSTGSADEESHASAAAAAAAAAARTAEEGAAAAAAHAAEVAEVRDAHEEAVARLGAAANVLREQLSELQATLDDTRNQLKQSSEAVLKQKEDIDTLTGELRRAGWGREPGCSESAPDVYASTKLQAQIEHSRRALVSSPLVASLHKKVEDELGELPAPLGLVSSDIASSRLRGAVGSVLQEMSTGLADLSARRETLPPRASTPSQFISVEVTSRQASKVSSATSLLSAARGSQAAAGAGTGGAAVPPRARRSVRMSAASGGTSGWSFCERNSKAGQLSRQETQMSFMHADDESMASSCSMSRLGRGAATAHEQDEELVGMLTFDEEVAVRHAATQGVFVQVVEAFKARLEHLETDIAEKGTHREERRVWLFEEEVHGLEKKFVERERCLVRRWWAHAKRFHDEKLLYVDMYNRCVVRCRGLEERLETVVHDAQALREHNAELTDALTREQLRGATEKRKEAQFAAARRRALEEGSSGCGGGGGSGGARLGGHVETLCSHCRAVLVEKEVHTKFAHKAKMQAVAPHPPAKESASRCVPRTTPLTLAPALGSFVRDELTRFLSLYGANTNRSVSITEAT